MRAIVIGAGISGLACAFRLAERGAEVTVLERAGRVGGVIESVTRGGFLFELGPQSFQPATALTELIRAAGIEKELQSSPARAPRYVFARGLLRRVPMGPGILTNGSLLGFGTRLRLLWDLVGWSKPPEHEESVAEFVRRKFGHELLDRLAGPFISGIYAGDPERLGLRDAFGELHRWEVERGSVLRGAMRSRAKGREARPTLASLLHGNATLLDALAAKLAGRVRLGACVEFVSLKPPGFEVHFVESTQAVSLIADAVIVAAPADVAASILRGIALDLVEPLDSIEYAPVAVVGTGYRREQVRYPLDGFGFLVARSEGLRLLGTVWTSSLFSGRAPAGSVSLASFVGGATDPSITRMSPDTIAGIVESELASILGIIGPPIERVVNVYRRALPQYNVGHRRLVERIRSDVLRVPGLFLVGNYLDGPSTGACVELAFRTAEAACGGGQGHAG